MKLNNILYVLAAAMAAFTGCKSSTADESVPETIKNVKIETITNGITQNSITLNGKVKEKSLTSLSFRVGGPLLK
ncbi:MAG TPA: hypothetical protein VEP89_01735, partial [Draconibacterium sp.]|nr:hypothetical protein [Draconibacterium sp.]